MTDYYIPPQTSVKTSTSAAKALLPSSFNEEDPNFNPNFSFSSTSNPTTSIYSLRPAISSYELEPNANEEDIEFSVAFSPETLTRENACSSPHPNDEVRHGLPQLWQETACIPFQENRIAEFRMGVNTYLSVSDLGFYYLKDTVEPLEVDTDLDKGAEVALGLETADETFWTKSTTRRPAPGTEWEFESQLTCVARGKEREGFAWGGRGEGGIEGSQGDDRRSLVGRKKIAIERLKGVLAHLAA